MSMRILWQEALSLPVRGAWVEIIAICHHIYMIYSRSPCGERGLKSLR